MARLIDADALLKKIWEQGRGLPNAYPLTRYAELLVLEAPTIDAVLVKHGRWIEHEHFCYTSFGEPVEKLASTFACSVCGRYESCREPFCHCGAKMDKEGEA